MAVFDLENLNEGAWFPYGDDAKVKVRAVPQEVINKIREKYVKIVIDYKKKKHGDYQRFKEPEVNPKDFSKVREETIDYTVQDWAGFVDKAGKKIPCTKKTKVKLMDGSPQFSTFIEECTEQLTRDAIEDQEAQEKN